MKNKSCLIVIFVWLIGIILLQPSFLGTVISSDFGMIMYNIPTKTVFPDVVRSRVVFVNTTAYILLIFAGILAVFLFRRTNIEKKERVFFLYVLAGMLLVVYTAVVIAISFIVTIMAFVKV